MRILVLGGGGREHAIAHTLLSHGHEVYCSPGNAGTQEVCRPFVESKDLDVLALAAKEEGINLTVVGPEALLAEGIVDRFEGHGLKAFGPSKAASILETSKQWSKDFMARHGIPTAAYTVCTEKKAAVEAAAKLFREGSASVVKASGLAAGKGVTVCRTFVEAVAAIDGLQGETIVIEERLHGPELSLLAFCDGKSIVSMPTAQDYKRLLEGGLGPNTGGMGACAPAPFVDDALLAEIHETIVKRTQIGLEKEQIDYRGVLYFGILVTENGPKLLEYNVRFGDPEAQALLPLLQSDLAEIMLASIHGTLQNVRISWSDESACTVVLCSGGYPKEYRRGLPISGLALAEKDALVFHAGTKVKDGEVVTNGGRVLALTGVAADLDSASESAYKAVQSIHFDDVYFRKDIARQKQMVAG